MRGATADALPYMTEGKISTHTPHAGRDLALSLTAAGNWQFLLTRPMRGATGTITVENSAANISTHTPHAGRDKGV